MCDAQRGTHLEDFPAGSGALITSAGQPVHTALAPHAAGAAGGRGLNGLKLGEHRVDAAHLGGDVFRRCRRARGTAWCEHWLEHEDAHVVDQCRAVLACVSWGQLYFESDLL